MKKRLVTGVFCGVLIIAWAVRYLTLNHGHVFSYPENPITYYKLNEEVPYGQNIPYYGNETQTIDGYTLRITDWELVTSADFANRYGTFENQMGLINRPYYLIADAAVANYGTSADGVDLNSLILRGVDWWAYCSYGQTLLVNSATASPDLYNTGTLKLPTGESMSVKIVFGLETNLLTMNRWQNFTDETIWITQTIFPEEHRILLQ